MKNNWNELELTLALRLYYQLPFGKMHKGNAEIKKLAQVINRTPSAVAMKLGNFARFDTKLRMRNIKGLTNGSKQDLVIWNKFIDLNFLEEETNKIIVRYNDSSLLDLFQNEPMVEETSLKSSEIITKGRRKQSFFRKIVLSNYNNCCCITGLSCPTLLVASHIIPWSKNERERLNPQNGLLLNSIHDKAFDQGLITINFNYEIILSEIIRKLPKSKFIEDTFLSYENKSISLPDKYLPTEEFIKYHNKYIFKDTL